MLSQGNDFWIKLDSTEGVPKDVISGMWCDNIHELWTKQWAVNI